MKVTTRTILGKKLKSLRKNGLLPAVIYDKDTNINVQIPVSEFQKVYAEKGHTGLVKAELGKESHNILIDHVQINPVTRLPIHATLREVNLKEEINAEVPLHFINDEECKGVKEDGGIIVESINEVEILALPTDIPQYLEIDLTDLRLGDSVKLEDIKLPKGVKFATDDENLLSQVVVSVTHKVVEEIPEGPTETVVAEGTKEKKEESTESAE